MYDLAISRSLLTRIGQYAVTQRPLECCGLLVGSREGGAAAIRGAILADNVHPGDRTKAFEIDPGLVSESLLGDRFREHCLLGFFHSHPDHAPLPSRRDEQLAWPDLSYLILGSLTDGSWMARSWRWLGPERELIEERLRVVGESDLQ